MTGITIGYLCIQLNTPPPPHPWPISKQKKLVSFSFKTCNHRMECVDALKSKTRWIAVSRRWAWMQRRGLWTAMLSRVVGSVMI